MVNSQPFKSEFSHRSSLDKDCCVMNSISAETWNWTREPPDRSLLHYRCAISAWLFACLPRPTFKREMHIKKIQKTIPRFEPQTFQLAAFIAAVWAIQLRFEELVLIAYIYIYQYIYDSGHCWPLTADRWPVCWPGCASKDSCILTDLNSVAHQQAHQQATSWSSIKK